MLGCCILPSEHGETKSVPEAAFEGCACTEKLTEWKVKVTVIMYLPNVSIAYH